jgi:hypothetical protein
MTNENLGPKKVEYVLWIPYLHKNINFIEDHAWNIISKFQYQLSP